MLRLKFAARPLDRLAQCTRHSIRGVCDRSIQAVNRVMSSPSDPYSVLGVSRTATGAEINRAYLSLSMLIHPDKCEVGDKLADITTSSPVCQVIMTTHLFIFCHAQLADATMAFTAVGSARSLLLDPERRAAIDGPKPRARRRSTSRKPSTPTPSNTPPPTPPVQREHAFSMSMQHAYLWQAEAVVQQLRAQVCGLHTRTWRRGTCMAAWGMQAKRTRFNALPHAVSKTGT